jgi:hypothetical protein
LPAELPEARPADPFQRTAAHHPPPDEPRAEPGSALTSA